MSIELELAHYGVKGMRWGVRNSRPEGVSRSTNRADAVKGAGKAARGAKNVALGNYRNVGVGILATAALFKGGQALGVIPANSVIKDRAHAAGTKVYNKIRKTSIDGIRSSARWAAERQRNKDFYDQFRAAGIKI